MHYLTLSNFKEGTRSLESMEILMLQFLSIHSDKKIYIVDNNGNQREVVYRDGVLKVVIPVIAGYSYSILKDRYKEFQLDEGSKILLEEFESSKDTTSAKIGLDQAVLRAYHAIVRRGSAQISEARQDIADKSLKTSIINIGNLYIALSSLPTVDVCNNNHQHIGTISYYNGEWQVTKICRTVPWEHFEEAIKLAQMRYPNPIKN